MFFNYFSILCLAIVLVSCHKSEPEVTQITFDIDQKEFINPERGFYRPFGTKMSSFEPLDAAELVILQSPKPAAGGFQVGSILTYRSFQFDTFKDKPLTEDILTKIQADLNTVRAVGNKMILRFTYSDNCCTPPFNDAPKATILQHLRQLQPVLKKNVDVIAVVQMGLIGPWGEQFYSDYFGDLEHGPVTAKNWEDRSEVLQTLLDVVPESRMVQVRAPYYKLRFVDGEKAHPEKATALTIENAFDKSALARIAHHNDCMLANYDDYWTYNSFHEWPAVSDTLNLKKYIADETKFLVFGGETCPGGAEGEDVFSPYNDCISAGGNAQNYLKRFHTSFLNTAWSGAVNGDWNNKCIDEIKRNLGYRFVLTGATLHSQIKSSEPFKGTLNFINEGYASTYNKRKVELVLRSKRTQKIYKEEIATDPRYWFTDEIQNVTVDIQWPKEIPTGDYELFINLPDPEPTLTDRPEYAIRLASTKDGASIWEAKTGCNRLLGNIKVR